MSAYVTRPQLRPGDRVRVAGHVEEVDQVLRGATRIRISWKNPARFDDLASWDETTPKLRRLDPGEAP